MFGVHYMGGLACRKITKFFVTLYVHTDHARFTSQLTHQEAKTNKYTLTTVPPRTVWGTCWRRCRSVCITLCEAPWYTLHPADDYVML